MSVFKKLLACFVFALIVLDYEALRCLGENEPGIGRDLNDYFVSTDIADWDTAKEDCKKIHGKSASLVSIETEKEFTMMKELINKHGETGQFWVAGYWSVKKKSFMWEETREPITNGTGWAKSPWKDIENEIKTAKTRITVHKKSYRNMYFVPAEKDELRRYICEHPV